MSQATFSFEQLSPAAQAKALDVCRDINTSDEYWYEQLNESTLDQFLEILGFEDPKIYFSLAYCQGDYAELNNARFHYNKGFVKQLKAEFPTWTKAHEMAEQLQAICKRYFYGYSFSVVNGRTCDIEHKRLGTDWQHDISAFESEIDDFMDDLNSMLYNAYRDEYEILSSDENVKAYLIEEDHQFFADGTDKKTVYANAA